MDGRLVAFLAVAVVLIVTPGPDMALIARNALRHDLRAAILTALGICTGLAMWTTASAIGVAALLQASETAFTALRWAGGAYLVFLGVQAFRSSGGAASMATADATDALSAPRAFQQGLLTNLLNPKIVVFFSSLLPQFVEPSDPPVLTPLLFGALFSALGLAWLVAYAAMVARVGDALRRPSVRTLLDRVTGVVLVGFGVRLAVQGR